MSHVKMHISCTPLLVLGGRRRSSLSKLLVSLTVNGACGIYGSLSSPNS